MVLKYTPQQPVLRFREINAADELVLVDVSTHSALQLLDRLFDIQGAPGTNIVSSRQIVTADRDRILAAVYINLYGSQIESTVNCRFCPEKFDIRFSLDDLQAFMYSQPVENGVKLLDDGTYKLDSGCHFRLPTGEDELQVAGYLSREAGGELLKRCVLEGDLVISGEEIQRAMQRMAPVLQTEIAGQCPECGKEQQLQFDIQSFLLTRLRNERKQTTWEIHRLASAYKWSHQEILNLPRSIRKMYVSYIRAEFSQ